MAVQAVIKTQHLTRLFGEKTAVDDLTIEVWPGEVFGCLGHNGAGKTTTIRLLNGVLVPTSGEVKVLGLSPQENGAALRKRTGVLTETPSLDERLNAVDNLTIYADLYGVPETEVKGRVEELLNFFDLSAYGQQKVGGYSKGMKQRLALSRALIHSPEILFLDEPTSGLDPVSSRSVHDLIRHLSRKEGRAVFLCTHNLPEAQSLCDRVAVLEHGRILAIGTPAELGRQVVQTRRLEIEVDETSVKAATEILERFTQGSVQKENGVISVVGVDHGAIPELVSAMVGKGIRIYRVDPLEPSLEDVYFALHNQEGPKE